MIPTPIFSVRTSDITKVIQLHSNHGNGCRDCDLVFGTKDCLGTDDTCVAEHGVWKDVESLQAVDDADYEPQCWADLAPPVDANFPVLREDSPAVVSEPDCCMCGDSMDHSPWEAGHNPVSMRAHYAADGTKLTNPKDLIGSSKLPLNLVPDTLAVYASMAFAEGASKYGAFNWRHAGVRSSIYKAAHDRHMAKWWNGETCDPVTGVPHLSSAIACLAIIADAHTVGKLTDDRPPPAALGQLIGEAETVVAGVYELNAERKPHHWTIADTEEAA